MNPTVRIDIVPRSNQIFFAHWNWGFENICVNLKFIHSGSEYFQ